MVLRRIWRRGVPRMALSKPSSALRKAPKDHAALCMAMTTSAVCGRCFARTREATYRQSSTADRATLSKCWSSPSVTARLPSVAAAAAEPQDGLSGADLRSLWARPIWGRSKVDARPIRGRVVVHLGSVRSGVEVFPTSNQVVPWLGPGRARLLKPSDTQRHGHRWTSP